MNPNNKIRILHLVQTLGMGGAEMLLYHHIQALGFEHYEHYVYCFGDDGPIRGKIEALGVPVCIGKKRAKMATIFKFISTTWALIRDVRVFIQNKGIQIIQSHLGQANQMAVLLSRLSGVPAFPTVHSTMAFVDERCFFDPRALLIKVVDYVIYDMADHVIVVSEEIKAIIQRRYHIKDSKILVLKNGIITESSYDISAIDEKGFDVPTRAAKLVAVGRLVPSKGFDVLVRAVAELVRNGETHIFALIVGEGNQRSHLEKLVKNLHVEKFVRLMGLRHDVMRIMTGSDIFVMPSRYEGLSIAMIEAMACGLPIIASNAPGLRDCIVDCQNGMSFPVDDHEALAACIKRLFNDAGLRRKLSDNARRSFDIEYNMLNNINALDAVYRGIAVLGG